MEGLKFFKQLKPILNDIFNNKKVILFKFYSFAIINACITLGNFILGPLIKKV